MIKEMKTILDFSGGQVTEIINDRISELMFNIQDINTDLKSRELNVKVKLTPIDDRRTQLSVEYQTSIKVRPIKPVSAQIHMGIDDNGQIEAVELTAQMPGQIGIDGKEQSQNVIFLNKKTV